MPNRHSSRRVRELKESEIDHEINLVDNAPPLAQTPEEIDTDATCTLADVPLDTTDSRAPLTDGAAPLANGGGQNGHATPNSQRPPTPSVEPPTPENEAEPSGTATPKKQARAGNGVSRIPSKHRERKPRRSPHPRMKEPATAIDVLYENERGGFLCGLPLFSGAALGNLDPPPWTNELHKPSPTDIRTAQVPDPSWTWAWPSWRVNQDEAIETDKDGWEYSFMFSRWFSWHGPHWYNSFVRRRAWIRRRVQQGAGWFDNGGVDAQLLNPEYFTVTPQTHPRPTSRPNSRVSSMPNSRTPSVAGRSSASHRDEDRDDGWAAGGSRELPPPNVKTIDELMTRLQRSCIDRERLDAVNNYLDHDTDDLRRLHDHMHDIMSLFVFQASRRLLLTRLMEIRDEHESWTKDEARETSSTGTGEEKEEKAKDGAEERSLVTSGPATMEPQQSSASPPPPQEANGSTTPSLGKDKEPGVQNKEEGHMKENGRQNGRLRPEAAGNTGSDGRSPGGASQRSMSGVRTARRLANLEVAIRHADEEVRRLEYWSDVRGMAENGEAGAAVSSDRGWGPEWEGLDRSGG